MIFNFSNKFQFTTSLSVNEEKIEVVKDTKLFGTILTDDLKWEKNTKEIVKKSYQRMRLLNTAAGFTSNVQDLKSIYLTYIRSILEQSAVVWHSGLTTKNRRSLERVQKAAVRVILKQKYTSYKTGLEYLNLQTLEQRRELLCLRFAKKCLQNEKVKDMFPKKISVHKMKKRRNKPFKENNTKTKRYGKSAIHICKNFSTKILKRKTKNVE